MKLFSIYLYLAFLNFTLFLKTSLSQETGNHSLHFHSDILKHVKLQLNWRKEISEDSFIRRKCLNILLSKRYELSISVPGPANRTNYLESFPNRFALVHRLIKVWPLLRTLVSLNFGASLRSFYIPIDGRLLYESALISVVRLQETYNLSTEALSRGRLDGAYPYTSMTSATIMDVVMFYRRLGHPWKAQEWLLEALNRTDFDNSASKRTILEYLHITNCYIADIRNSTEVMTRLIKEYPSLLVDDQLQDDYNFISNTSCLNLSYKFYGAFFDNTTSPHFIFNQADLCIPGLYKPPYILDPRLRCRLIHYNKQHLRLAPFKVEEINLDPPVLIIYDVIHDSEIKTIKQIYQNKTRPAVNDYRGVKDRYFDTQYTTWLLNKSDPITKMIDRRASSAANADLFRAEHPMVASYGLGAEIKLHEDLIPDDRYLLNDGRTRADYISFLFYLNDVSEGGYTIFPHLDLAVVPVKGAALMWHNRLPDWTRDDRTRHSGCPVLRGSKWIINKWFHVRGQHYPQCYPGRKKSRQYYYLPDTL